MKKGEETGRYISKVGMTERKEKKCIKDVPHSVYIIHISKYASKQVFISH